VSVVLINEVLVTIKELEITAVLFGTANKLNIPYKSREVIVLHWESNIGMFALPYVNSYLTFRFKTKIAFRLVQINFWKLNS
jgi:hypothetical protein